MVRRFMISSTLARIFTALGKATSFNRRKATSSGRQVWHVVVNPYTGEQGRREIVFSAMGGHSRQGTHAREWAQTAAAFMAAASAI